MVDARTELQTRSRAIASGELPLPERYEGESDADWLERIATSRGRLPARGERLVVITDFWATEFLRGPRVRLHVGESLTVVGHTTLLGSPVVRCQVDGDESGTVVQLDAYSIRRFTMQVPCRGPLPAGVSKPRQNSESAGESFEPQIDDATVVSPEAGG